MDNTALTALILIVAGLAIAFFGRRFLWLFAALVGLAAGITLVNALFAGASPVVAWVAGIALGVILAFAARTVARIVMLIIGFLMGFIIAGDIASALGITSLPLQLIVLLAGGIIGVAAVRFAFGPAVIILSSLAGGALVGQGVARLWAGAPSWLFWVLLAVVAIAGIAYQWKGLKSG